MSQACGRILRSKSGQGHPWPNRRGIAAVVSTLAHPTVRTDIQTATEVAAADDVSSIHEKHRLACANTASPFHERRLK
jgi:hypothetical protein